MRWRACRAVHFDGIVTVDATLLAVHVLWCCLLQTCSTAHATVSMWGTDSCCTMPCVTPAHPRLGAPRRTRSAPCTARLCSAEVRCPHGCGCHTTTTLVRGRCVRLCVCGRGAAALVVLCLQCCCSTRAHRTSMPCLLLCVMVGTVLHRANTSDEPSATEPSPAVGHRRCLVRPSCRASPPPSRSRGLLPHLHPISHRTHRSVVPPLGWLSHTTPLRHCSPPPGPPCLRGSLAAQGGA